VTLPYIWDSEVPLAAVGSPSVHTVEDIAYYIEEAAEDTAHRVVRIARAAYCRFAEVRQYFVQWGYHIQHRNSHQDYSAARNLRKERRPVLLRLEG